MKNFISVLFILVFAQIGQAQILNVVSEQEAMERMSELQKIFKQKKDKKIYFNGVYLVVTKELKKERVKPDYDHPECLEGMIIQFANMYIDALNKDNRNKAPLPWKELFEFKGRPTTHLLLGMNAHISYDLPLSMYQIYKNQKSCTPENIKEDFFKLNNFFIRLIPILDQELKKMHQFVSQDLVSWDDLEKRVVIELIKILRKNAWNSYLSLIEDAKKGDYEKRKKKIENSSQERAILIKNMNFIIPPVGFITAPL